MQTKIGIKKYCISCIIGDNPEERERVQDIFIDVEVEADVSACVLTDALSETIDYRLLAELCNDIAKKGQFRLIETYAAKAAKKLLDTFPIQSVLIRVEKPKALLNAASSYVLLHLKKNGT